MKRSKLFAFFAGLSGITVFYLTLAVILANVISSRIEAETNGASGIFATWWQTLLFVLDIVFALACAAFIVLAVMTKKKARSEQELKQREGPSESI